MTDAERQRLVKRITDVVVEEFRPGIWVVVEEVEPGQWACGRRSC